MVIIIIKRLILEKKYSVVKFLRLMPYGENILTVANFCIHSFKF